MLFKSEIGAVLYMNNTKNLATETNNKMVTKYINLIDYNP